jgi:transposase
VGSVSGGGDEDNGGLAFGGLVANLQAQIAGLQARLGELERERDEYRKLYLLAREEIAQLKRGLIGRRGERPLAHDPQLSLAVLGLLFGEGAVAPVPDPELVAEHVRRKAVRNSFPEHLPRVRVEVVPLEVERAGRDAFEVIGVDTREVLERRPASLVVVEVVKPKFVRKGSQAALTTEVLAAETPELPIPRGTAGPGLLADSVVKRWQDHLPLNRQEAICRRDGTELNCRSQDLI